jgi:adenosylmethionine-8-amino-7-oxononanoate aminotransferase
MSERTVRWPFIPAARSIDIARAEGAYLYTTAGHRILDAAGGAIVVNVGHGRESVVRAVAAETAAATYAVPTWLTPGRIALIERLQRDWLPAALDHVHLTSGGSEGVEAMMKIAIQYHAARGEPERRVIVGRTISYHGTTIATMAVGGHEARKHGLSHSLPHYPKAPTPYPLRCPLGATHRDVGRYYVDALRAVIEAEGPRNVAAFLAEPISGSSGGAIVPPDDYWTGVRALCDEYGILLLLDEVMTGFGRTGRNFGFEHFSVVPDVMVAGKGLGGGYAPITGVFARGDIARTIADARMNVMFHTFGAHPAACAAANEVLRILTDEKLVPRAAEMGRVLAKRLRDALSNHPHVAEIRGRGLLHAVEIVRDRDSLEPYPIEANVTNRVITEALKRGVFFYIGGTGVVRDIVCMGPPFTVTATDIDLMTEVLAESITEVTAKI